MKVKIRGRYLVLFLLFVLVLAALTIKLSVIQLFKTEKYAALSEKDSCAVLSGINVRGTIYDRNMNPITEADEGYLLLIEKRKADGDLDKLLTSINARNINRFNKLYQIFSTGVKNREAEEVLCGKYGAIMLRTRERYSENQPAVHIVGYLNERDAKGVYGIEKDYEKLLAKDQPAYSGKVDGQGYLIKGLGLMINKEATPFSIMTTLDLNLQKAAEKVLADAEAKGVIIITDPGTGEILASASSPVFNPYRIAEYLESDGKELLNKAVGCQYPPGSVFKIIVAAAALENEVAAPDTLFLCRGFYETAGLRVKCSTGGANGHGEISFTRAFADSCNSVFVQIGEMVGGEEILTVARNFGLGEEAVSGMSGQEKGRLPATEDSLGAGIGNLSIGQGKMLVTPMQVARINNIIASGGFDAELTLVLGVIDESKNILRIPSKKRRRVISKDTARALRLMMTETVKNGTADNLILPVSLSAAGKTGSAEAGIRGNSEVHSWFVGFVPSINPKYAVTVFVEGGGAGRKSAVPLFSDLLQQIQID